MDRAILIAALLLLAANTAVLAELAVERWKRLRITRAAAKYAADQTKMFTDAAIAAFTARLAVRKSEEQDHVDA